MTPASEPEPPSWIGIAGPTASGKTAAALAVAQALAPERRVEIVSVDSALVYRGLDIGTAKPDAAERAQVPHHLIDLRDPADPYSAAAFADDAKRLVDAIRARGSLPLLVGGTMLYFKALLDGLDAMPPADPALRAELEAEAALRGWPAMHAELATVDPASAARLAPNDAQRVQRALEVWRATGRPLSSFHGRQERKADSGAVLVSLEPESRAWLHERIARRFHAMLEAGFVDEVRRLRTRPDLHADLPALRSVGYRQAWEALDAGRLDDLAERGIAATRQLAKRQLTWLRGMPARLVVVCDAPDACIRVVSAVRAVLNPQDAG